MAQDLHREKNKAEHPLRARVTKWPSVSPPAAPMAAPTAAHASPWTSSAPERVDGHELTVALTSSPCKIGYHAEKHLPTAAACVPHLQCVPLAAAAWSATSSSKAGF